MTNSRVSRGRSGVVGEAQPIPVPASPFVEDALITAIPTALGSNELHDLIELILSRFEDHEARVEDVRPTDIRDGTELVGECEEMCEGSDGENIRVEEDDLVELGETEDV